MSLDLRLGKPAGSCLSTLSPPCLSNQHQWKCQVVAWRVPPPLPWEVPGGQAATGKVICAAWWLSRRQGIPSYLSGPWAPRGRLQTRHLPLCSGCSLARLLGSAGVDRGPAAWPGLARTVWVGLHGEVGRDLGSGGLSQSGHLHLVPGGPTTLRVASRCLLCPVRPAGAGQEPSLASGSLLSLAGRGEAGEGVSCDLTQ